MEAFEIHTIFLCLSPALLQRSQVLKMAVYEDIHPLSVQAQRNFYYTI
jgi:hypothetical protein